VVVVITYCFKKNVYSGGGLHCHHINTFDRYIIDPCYLTNCIKKKTTPPFFFLRLVITVKYHGHKQEMKRDIEIVEKKKKDCICKLISKTGDADVDAIEL